MCCPRGHRGSRQGAQPVKQSDEKSQKQRHGMVILSSSKFSLYLRRRALSIPLLLLMPATFGLGSRCSPTCARSKVDWSQQFLRSNGKVTHALPGCVEHIVRDDRCDPNQSKFADPFRTQRVALATR